MSEFADITPFCASQYCNLIYKTKNNSTVETFVSELTYQMVV